MWGLPGPERAQKKVRGSLVKVENLETPTLGTSGARASSAKTRGFHTQLDEGPETP